MDRHLSDYHHEKIKSLDDQPAFNIYKGETLLAEVRGTDSSSQMVIPMRELDDDEEDKLHEYINKVTSEQ